MGDKEFIMGYLTIADFFLSEFSHYFEAIYPNEYKKYSFLGTIRRNFNKIPSIQQYYKRNDAKTIFMPPSFLKIELKFAPEISSQIEQTGGIKLGYWKIRGRAHICRLLLAYAKVVFEDVSYTSPDMWQRDKKALNIEFPNLPYLITPDIKLS